MVNSGYTKSRKMAMTDWWWMTHHQNLTLRGDKSVNPYISTHKLLKIKVAITKLTVHIICGVVSALVICQQIVWSYMIEYSSHLQSPLWRKIKSGHLQSPPLQVIEYVISCILKQTPEEKLVAICNHQTDCPVYLWPDAWFGDLETENSVVIHHDTECSYWDQESLNNTKIKFICNHQCDRSLDMTFCIWPCDLWFYVGLMGWLLSLRYGIITSAWMAWDTHLEGVNLYWFKHIFRATHHSWTSGVYLWSCVLSLELLKSFKNSWNCKIWPHNF